MVYTLEEVAEILKVSVQTIRKIIAEKKLRAFRGGQWRVRKEDLDKYIESQFS
jgi:excisionase family DNA binding protein